MADTSFEINLGVAGAAAVDSAATSVDALTAKLTASESAAAAAATALKAGEASYRAAESAADSAAKSVEKIGVAIEGQTAKLQAAMNSGNEKAFWKAAGAIEALKQKQTDAVAAADAAKTALASEAAALDKLKASAAGASDAQKNVASALDKAKDAAKKAAEAEKAAQGSGKVNEIAEAFGKLGGPLGQLGQKVFGAAEGFKKFGSSLGSAGGYLAIATAILAISAAIISAAYAAAKWAVELADVNRTNKLLADGIAGTVEGGAALNDQLTQLSKTTPFTRDELSKMAADIAKTGKTGHELADALDDAVNTAAKAKWGPDWKKQLNSIDGLTKRLQANFSSLFGSLQIDKLLEAFGSLVDLFDDSNASGQAMKTVFLDLMQPLINGVAEFLPKMRTAFIQFEILVMKGLIAIKPYGSQLAFVGDALKEIGILAAISFGVLIASAVAVGAVIALAVASLKWFYDGIIEGGKIVADYVAKSIQGFQELGAFLSGFAQMGVDLVMGLANGIKSAASAVIDAITGVVKGGIDAAKKLLGIASPSKVFAEIGVNTGEGMVGGVESVSGNVQGSLESMVAPPEPSSAPSPALSTGGSSANLAGATFNFYGVEGAEDAQGRFEDLITKLIEGDVAQLGGAVPA